MPRSRESRDRDNARHRELRAARRHARAAVAVVVDDMAPEEPEEEPMAVQDTQPLFWTRFTVPGLGFFTYHGVNYDRGQLMPMVGGPRDEQLVRLGYVQPAMKEEAHLQAQCGVCGVWFLTEQFRDAHGRLRHSDRFAQEDLSIGGGMDGPDGGAALRDITGDAEERQMQQRYPLHLDRTRATLESGPA